MLEVFVYLVLISDPAHNSMSLEQQRSTFNACAAEMSNTLGIHLVVKKVWEVEKDPYAEVNQLGRQRRYFYLWRAEMLKRNRRRYWIRYAVVPPAVDPQGRYWMYGFNYSEWGRKDRQTGIGVGEFQNHLAIARAWHSIEVCRHELGHAFGAPHDKKKDLNPAHIMHPDPLPRVVEGEHLSFSDRSLSLMARWVRRVSNRLKKRRWKKS